MLYIINSLVGSNAAGLQLMNSVKQISSDAVDIVRISNDVRVNFVKSYISLPLVQSNWGKYEKDIKFSFN
jgi:hypothetical protein